MLMMLLVMLLSLNGSNVANAQTTDSLHIDLNSALEIALSENPTVKWLIWKLKEGVC